MNLPRLGNAALLLRGLAGARAQSRAAPLRRAARPRSTAQTSLPPLIYPDAPRSAKHKDLPSFLRYAEQSGLGAGTTIYVGTHYEYTVSDHLAAFGFALRRVGGASDLGIDLLGTWTLPIPLESDGHQRTPLRVILQCKAGSGQRIGPSLVRELEGAFVGAPVGWRTRVGERDGSKKAETPEDDGEHYAEGSPAVIGLLVTEKPATKGIRDALSRSRWPMAYICCSSTGHIQQVLWNQSAEKSCGLAGLGVTLRHPTGTDEAPAHVVLTWQGLPLPPVRSEPAEDQPDTS